MYSMDVNTMGSQSVHKHLVTQMTKIGLKMTNL